MMNNKVSFTNSNNPTISLSAVIYFPPKFDETRQYQAIVVSHPGGGVKEQTAGTYAKKLAEKGFVTIAYDASYQGESGGEPRQLENPYIRTEDISAVIDYLTTLSSFGASDSFIGASGITAYSPLLISLVRAFEPASTYGRASIKESDAPNEELRQAWEYYHTPRAQYPT
ncbi:alpha/beta hydrolase, partial [Escherichia sp. SP-MK]